jgi:hypothetical protein
MTELIEISDTHVITAWVALVGCGYLFLDFRKRNRRQKERRQPKYYTEKTGSSL